MEAARKAHNYCYQSVNQSIYLYCHVSSEIYMHMERDMVLRALIHTFTVQVNNAYIYIYIYYNNTIDKPQ